MAIKVPITYTEYKNFPVASDVSRKISSYSKIICIVAAAPVFLLYKGENILIAVFSYIVLAALGILIIRSFHNPAVMKAMFGSLKGLSQEQQQAFVNTFMHGRAIGKGDMGNACNAANLLLKEELALRNRKISKEQYKENVGLIMQLYSVQT